MHFQLHRPETGIFGNRRFLLTLYGIFAGDENVVSVQSRKGIRFKAEVIPELHLGGALDVVCMQHRKKTLRRRNTGCGDDFRLRFGNVAGEVVDVDFLTVGESPGLAELARSGKTRRAAGDGVVGGVQDDGVYRV